ncbi:hypothetical protein, partial [Streptomyces formicae]
SGRTFLTGCCPYKVVTAHRNCLPDLDDGTNAPRTPGGVIASRTRRVLGAVHALPEEGTALRAIGHRLNVDRTVVRQHACAAAWQEVAPTLVLAPALASRPAQHRICELRSTFGS